MADYRALLSNILYILWWPTSKFINILTFLFSPIWALARFFLLPFTHLFETILKVILFPFRADILDRIEVGTIDDLLTTLARIPSHATCSSTRVWKLLTPPSPHNALPSNITKQTLQDFSLTMI